MSRNDIVEKLNADRHDGPKETPDSASGIGVSTGRSCGSKIEVTSRSRDQALRQWLEQLLEGSCSRKESRGDRAGLEYHLERC